MNENHTYYSTLDVVTASLTNSSEIFEYRVVYDGGTYVRSTPDMNSEKTGEIIECGTILFTSKSIMMDGVNYVKLLDGSGWLFDRKGDIQILELIDCVRNNQKINDTHNSNYDMNSVVMEANKYRKKISHSPIVTSEAKYWKNIRMQCALLTNFDDFIKLVENVIEKPPDRSEPGPARSQWMIEKSLHTKTNIKVLISRLAAITLTNAFADRLNEAQGLEASLWIFVHLGIHASHVLELADIDVNCIFNIFTEESRNTMLETVLNVTQLNRPIVDELCHHVGVLADDVKLFIQRWIIIKWAKIAPKHDTAKEEVKETISPDQQNSTSIPLNPEMSTSLIDTISVPCTYASENTMDRSYSLLSTPIHVTASFTACMTQYIPRIPIFSGASQTTHDSSIRKREAPPLIAVTFMQKIDKIFHEATNDPDVFLAHLI